MDMRTTLFFTAEHELWPMVSGCRRMACGVGSGWGALHWEVDDFDLGPCDKTGTAGFYSALGDSCGSEGLNVIDGLWIGDSSPLVYKCSYSAKSNGKSSPL